MDRINYGRQFIDQSDIDSVIEVLKSDFLTQGPAVKKFEDDFKAKVNSKYAVAVCNATAALHMAMLALKVGEGDKIITTPLTFVADSNCALYVGAKVDFCDVDEETMLLDLNKLEDKLKREQYKALIAVDFAGLPMDWPSLKFLGEKYNVKLVDDACHAPGATYFDKEKNSIPVGSNKHSDISIFSFHPVKHIACGEGGMLTTNSDILNKKLLRLRSHGIVKDESEFEELSEGPWYSEMIELGFNYRLSDIQAALGISQLQKLDENISKRQHIAEAYSTFFDVKGIKYQVNPLKQQHAYHLFIARFENRKEVVEKLNRANIFPQVHYRPVHLNPFYKNLGFSKGSFPVAERLYESILSLPIYPSLKDQELAYILKELEKVIR